MKELKRRQEMAMNQYTPDSDPTRDQLSFHRSEARYRLAFGGNRAGKSVVTSYECAAWARGCHRFRRVEPGPKEIYVISAEYRTIYMGIHRHLAPDRDGMKFLDRSWIKEIGPKIPGATVPLPSYIQVWVEGGTAGDPERPYSTIWFISGDGGEQARKKMQAAAIDLIIIDEEVGQDLYDELHMRLLDKDGELCVSCTLVRSEDWLLELEDRAEEGDPAVQVIRLNTETSKHISDRAKREILGRLSEEERAVRVEGRSRRAFGLVFPNFGADHIFDYHKDFPNGFPSTFEHVACTDPGFRVHAGLWCAVDVTESTLYFWHEIYEKEAQLSDVCEHLANAEGYSLQVVGAEGPNVVHRRVPLAEKPLNVTRLIDPEALRHFEDGRVGIAHQMIAFYDTLVIPANNDVQSGVEATRRLLKLNPHTKRPHILVDWRLKHFLSERRRYKLRSDTSGRNAHATKAEPIRKANHLMDCFRYISIHVLTTMFGESIEQNRRTGSFNYALPIETALPMAERLKETFNREAALSPLGDEW
jgi:hypothetical protein